MRKVLMIEAQSLTKRFASGSGVSDLTFTVERGELFVFLGPNGAGKSTTVKMLTGLLDPDSGFACVSGFDSVRERLSLKRAIGYMAERPYLYDRLTAREYVTFVADVFAVPADLRRRRMAELFHAFEIADVADHLIETFSHGMRQKTALSAVLIHEPPVLFLDEPTNGLDPRSARIVKDVLRAICDRGATVFMTTHVLEIAEQMCDRVAIVDHGSLVALGTMPQLRSSTGLVDGTLEDVYLSLTGAAETPVLSLYTSGRSPA
jgi:ABC-2 type transport system ATP-binding protein